MAEREQSPVAAAEPEAGAIGVSRLPHLISAARESRGHDRDALAREINLALIAMRQPGHEAAEAQVVLTALEGHHLDKLVDAEGRSCRKEAVETLLACGFPHALNVGPEDLAFARAFVPVRSESAARTPWEKKLKSSRKLGAIAVVAGQLAFWGVIVAAGMGLATAWSLAAGGLASLIAIFFAASPPTIEGQSKWGTGLVLCLIAQLLSVLAIGPIALLGAAGISIGLLLAFGSQAEPRADPPKPGDWDYRDGS